MTAEHKVWTFPYDLVIRADDEAQRKHHTRRDAVWCYGAKHDIAALAMEFSANTRILEVGLRAGYSAWALLAAGPSHFVAIDADMEGEFPRWGGRRGWSLEAHLRGVERFPNVLQTLLLGTSQDVGIWMLAAELGVLNPDVVPGQATKDGPLWSPGFYGLVHIDGENSVRGSWIDLAMYACLVAPGGAMLVNGVNWDPGTQIAVGRFRTTHLDWTYRFFETGSFGGDALLVRPSEAEASGEITQPSQTYVAKEAS